MKTRDRKTFILTAAAAWGLMAAGATQAATTASSEVTYYFNANCADCAQAAGSAEFGVLGTLVLQDYTPGATITLANFVSFTYSGSNLAPAFTVTPDDSPSVLGSIPELLPSAASFELTYGDLLGFEAKADGRWYLCAPGTTSYYHDVASCNEMWNNDFGTGAFSTVQTVVLGPTGGQVPEPASALLAGAALVALSARRRSRG